MVFETKKSADKLITRLSQLFKQNSEKHKRWYAYGISNFITSTDMETINKQFFKSENYGGEFSILNSYNPANSKNSAALKANIYTVVLYVLSIVSIVFWIISLNILPFGHIFQFLLGSAVLFINILVFKWVRL